MRQVRLRGETLEISERDWDAVISHVAGKLYLPTKRLHDTRASGFPEVLDESTPPAQQELEDLRTVIAQVDNGQMRALLQALEAQTARVVELNGRFIEVVARFLGLPAPRTQEERQQFTERMSQYKLPRDEAMLSQPESFSWNPVWAKQADYRELVRQSEALFGEWEAIKTRIYFRYVALAQATDAREETPPEARRRLVRLLWSGVPTGVAEHTGDERAKHLIDMADGEGDSKRAVALLHRALRYGKTGLQAARACLRLGTHYDDAGDGRRAIDYYTKAIEACKGPNVSALYLRGKLYYRQERWVEAADDLERALAGGLRTPEHEWAQMLLSRSRARAGGEGGASNPE